MIRLAAAAFAALIAVLPVRAMPADPSPPYTEEQFFDLSDPEGTFLQSDARLRDWWGKQPQYLKTRILANERALWWPIILCNYQGFDAEQRAGGPINRCERLALEERRRGIGRWSPDGQYLGPSAACRAANKRDEFGRLICN